MRKLNDYTVGGYMAIAIFVVYGPLIYLIGEDLSIILTLSYYELMLIILNSSC